MPNSQGFFCCWRKTGCQHVPQKYLWCLQAPFFPAEIRGKPRMRQRQDQGSQSLGINEKSSVFPWHPQNLMDVPAYLWVFDLLADTIFKPLGGKLDCAAILGPGPLASVEVVKQFLERPRVLLHCSKVVTRKHQSIRQPGDIGWGPNLFIPWMTHTCFTHDTVDGSNPRQPPFGWWFFTL